MPTHKMENPGQSEAPHAECEASGSILEGGSRDKGFSEVTGGRTPSFLRTHPHGLSSVPTPSGRVPGFVTYLWGKPPAQGRDPGASERKNSLCPLSDTPLRCNPPLSTRNRRTFPSRSPEVEALVKTQGPAQSSSSGYEHPA